MKGASTIEDVARQAGVAISTVSHVINGTRFVSEQTTMAVERAIAATGYIPNSLARSLVREPTPSALPCLRPPIHISWS
jgi:LacI family transcriptional regulator